MPGLIDRTSGGRLAVTGKDRATFLHNLATQDILGLLPGQVRPAVIPTWKGTVQDWVSVAATDEALFLDLSPGREGELLAFFDKYNLYDDLQVRSLTAETGCLELVSAGAAELFQEKWGPLALGECRFQGSTRLWACKDGIEGAVYRIWMPIAELSAIAASLTEAGAKPWTPEEAETARIRWGIPQCGRELTDRINPWEARLGDSVSLTKGCYLGQEVIARLDSYDKVKQYLVGLRFETDAPDSGDVLADGGQVGFVTSHAGHLALGYVKTAYAQAGQAVDVGGQPAQVVDLPFWAGKVFGKEALRPSSSR